MWVPGPVPTPLLVQREVVAQLPALGPVQKLAPCGRGPRPACVLGASQLLLASLVLREGAAPDKHPSLPQTHPGLPCDKNQRSGALKAQSRPPRPDQSRRVTPSQGSPCPAQNPGPSLVDTPKVGSSESGLFSL
ncbi:unnamed protein product [Rangifer tarandus platyrhynchus]|uniref:Uncharacterized protein n=1 Tax=Rangifer tarandus platyrhynchus TaxID=3082113 RepID=A0AC59YYY5_RANTA